MIIKIVNQKKKLLVEENSQSTSYLIGPTEKIWRDGGNSFDEQLATCQYNFSTLLRLLWSVSPGDLLEAKISNYR